MTKIEIQDAAINFLRSEKQKLTTLFRDTESKDKKQKIAQKMLSIKQKMIWEIRNIDAEITEIRGEKP